jgi:beta-galactosidase
LPGELSAFGKAIVRDSPMKTAYLLLLAPVVLVWHSALCLGESTADKFLFPNGKEIYVGADYYPEHWPEDRWETDLQLMKEAGFNVVRVGEFSWVLFEPKDGEFDFSWLDRWFDLAEKYEIKVIIGTPTAIIPAWLARKYPETLSQKADGTRTVWGGRRHNCFSDADYHRLSDRVVRKIAEHYKSRPNLVGWQIDNEFGVTDCRCAKCEVGFQKWLEARYGSLDELNRAWGTHFWGQRFHAWGEIPIPDARVGEWAISNPSASLDWQRYVSDQNIDFLRDQVEVLREVCPSSQFITHNFMGLHASIDYYDLAKTIDFVGWDNYPKLSPSIPYDSSLSADVMRGLKKENFLVMEQTAGPPGWNVFTRSPQPGELRKICYQQLAHGADGQIWFRWRSCTAGREQYWHGLLGHDGKAGRRYREAAQLAKEYKDLAPHLVGTTVRSKVGILYDYDSIWALEIQNGYPGASHLQAIRWYYNALLRAGVGVDMLRPGDDLRNYRLVFAPHLHVLSDKLANQLVEYVRDGGVLLTDCRTGVKDESNLVHDRTLPGALSPALGIEINEYESLRLGIQDDEEVKYEIVGENQLDGKYTAVRYADWITPTTAIPVARYVVPQLSSYAAATRNEYGKGIGWYIGTVVDDSDFYDQVVDKVLADANVQPVLRPPSGVEVSLRSNAISGLLFLINHADHDVDVQVPAGRQELISGKLTTITLTLKPFGVAVIDWPVSELAASR